MTHITDMCGDHQPESSGWLFKSPLAGGGGILWRPPAQLVRDTVVSYSNSYGSGLHFDQFAESVQLRPFFNFYYVFFFLFFSFFFFRDWSHFIMALLPDIKVMYVCYEIIDLTD